MAFIPDYAGSVSLALALAIGVLTGYVIGKKSSSTSKKKANNEIDTTSNGLCSATKKENPICKDEVLFFPDSTTYANDTSLSRIDKGQLYKEILDFSEPLLRLEEHLKSATVSIDLCLYILTCHKLAEAVIERIEAADVKVRFIVDEASARLGGSMVPVLARKGAFVRMQRSDYLMHHKFAIVDGKKLMTGSFNWTMQAAMGNHENVIVTYDKYLVQAFQDQFEKVWRIMEAKRPR